MLTVKEVREQVRRVNAESHPTLRVMEAADLFRRVLQAVDEGRQDARLMAREALDAVWFYAADAQGVEHPNTNLPPRTGILAGVTETLDGQGVER